MAAWVLWGSLFLVFYVYLGYPALLALAAAFKPKPGWTPSPPWPSVTLLIAACNEEGCIAAKLRNCLSLEYPPGLLQVVVAADGSTDRTPAIVRSFEKDGVVLSYDPVRSGKMAAINRAMPIASGEIVVFSDANNLYSSRAIEFLSCPFKDAAVGAVTGAKKIIREEGGLSGSEGLYWKYESFIKARESRLGSCVAVAGEILAVRRNLFRPPPPKIINDDFYLAMDIARRGFRIVYVPEAVSREKVSALAREEMARRSRIIAGRYQAMGLSGGFLSPLRPVLSWQVISHKFLRPLIPFAMAFALLSNILIVLLPPAPGSGLSPAPDPALIRSLLLLQLLFYLLALTGNFVRPRGPLGKALYLPTFLVNSNLAALQGLYGYLSGKSTVLWKRVEHR